MRINDIHGEYFAWLVDLIGGDRYVRQNSYSKLLTYLHDTEFTYLIARDENRADDGISLRYRFITQNGYDEDDLDELEGPCSILEMLVALAMRCEETIMDDPSRGNRTGQWFWGMIVNLGLGNMTDGRYNRQRVEDSIDIFLNREYEYNGKGGLFTVKDPDIDMRDVEIWIQLCWYLDDIT